MREGSAAALDTGAAADLAAANRDLVIERRKLPRVSTWMRRYGCLSEKRFAADLAVEAFAVGGGARGLRGES